ncbi:MAG: EF-hand domain-containing protein [Deltaproteobacteria bacterium]|nr:EF-hand domain-containing protein [Deltaproteobacteria bacterium]
MKKIGTMVLILVGAVTILGSNYALGEGEGPRRHTRAKARFDTMDTNNDGKISHQEHMAKCEKRFKKMDADKDGFISKEESQSAWKKKKARMKERRSRMKPDALPLETKPGETKGSSQ